MVISKKTSKIHIDKEPPKPADMEKLAKELLENEFYDEETVNLGKNRGQYFMRLPTRITNNLDIHDTDKIKIIFSGDHKQKRLLLEVVKSVP